MKSYDDAADDFIEHVVSGLPSIQDADNYVEVLEEALKGFWKHAQEQAVFDHQMALFSYQMVRAINEGVGHEEVAKRLEISVEELRKRVLNPGDLTMTEMRLLALCAEVEITYDVFTPKTEQEEKNPA